MPEIRTDRDTITFVMAVTTAKEGCEPKLVLRCERDGEIYASIRVDASNDRP